MPFGLNALAGVKKGAHRLALNLVGLVQKEDERILFACPQKLLLKNGLGLPQRNLGAAPGHRRANLPNSIPQPLAAGQQLNRELLQRSRA